MVCNNDGGASGYGVFQRVDSVNWYLMVTAQNDALGTWTSARPASMNLSTGVLSINGNAATATQFSANTTVALTGDATGTSAGSKKGWSVPVTLANSGVTAGSYGPSTAVSPAHGGTFSVPYVTVDAKGRVTAASTVTITLPADSNTDTLMTQNVSTTDSTYPILLCATANATSNQGAKTGIFGSGVKVNPKTSVVSAKGFSGVPTGTMYVTAVKDGGALVNSQATAWGAIWRAPTKDYQVAGATWSSTNNNVYICYSVTNADVEAGTNTMAKSLVWAADTGTLTTTTFSGALSGNASSATEFSAAKDVTLTGDVTGTASSKAGWSVATTLSNSGVTAGTYGPSADVTGNNNATISVPEITVDAKGRVTAVNNRTYTSVNTDSDKKVYQYYKSDDNVYRLLFSNNSGNTATSNVGAVYSGLNNSFYVNPSTGSLYATKLYSGGTEVSVSGHTHTVSDITDISSLGLDTVLQTKATDSTTYPILLGATANNNATITDSTKFNTSLKANPRYGLVSLTNTFDTSAGKGVKPSSDKAQGTVAMYTQDTGDECAALRTYAYSSGTRGMFMRVYNWSDGTDVSPSGTANSCSLGVYVDKAGKAYCKASTAIWDNDFIPKANETGLIGVGGQRWLSIYAKNIYADTISGSRSCSLKLNLTSWNTSVLSHTISGAPFAPIYIMGSVTFVNRPQTVTLSFSGITNQNGTQGIIISRAVTGGGAESMTQIFYAQGFVTDENGTVSLQISRSNTQGNMQPSAFTLKVYQ